MSVFIKVTFLVMSTFVLSVVPLSTELVKENVELPVLKENEKMSDESPNLISRFEPVLMDEISSYIDVLDGNVDRNVNGDEGKQFGEDNNGKNLSFPIGSLPFYKDGNMSNLLASFMDNFDERQDIPHRKRYSQMKIEKIEPPNVPDKYQPLGTNAYKDTSFTPKNVSFNKYIVQSNQVVPHVYDFNKIMETYILDTNSTTKDEKTITGSEKQNHVISGLEKKNDILKKQNDIINNLKKQNDIITSLKKTKDIMTILKKQNNILTNLEKKEVDSAFSKNEKESIYQRDKIISSITNNMKPIRSHSTNKIKTTVPYHTHNKYNTTVSRTSSYEKLKQTILPYYSFGKDKSTPSPILPYENLKKTNILEKLITNLFNTFQDESEQNTFLTKFKTFKSSKSSEQQKVEKEKDQQQKQQSLKQQQKQQQQQQQQLKGATNPFIIQQSIVNNKKNENINHENNKKGNKIPKSKLTIIYDMDTAPKDKYPKPAKIIDITIPFRSNPLELYGMKSIAGATALGAIALGALAAPLIPAFFSNTDRISIDGWLSSLAFWKKWNKDSTEEYDFYNPYYNNDADYHEVFIANDYNTDHTNQQNYNYEQKHPATNNYYNSYSTYDARHDDAYNNQYSYDNQRHNTNYHYDNNRRNKKSASYDNTNTQIHLQNSDNEAPFHWPDINNGGENIRLSHPSKARQRENKRVRSNPNAGASLSSHQEHQEKNTWTQNIDTERLITRQEYV